MPKNTKYDMIDYFFLEIENPIKFDDPELRKKAIDRLGFWEKVSAKTLEMEYVPPPLQEGKGTVDNLMLNVIVCSPKLKTTSIPKEKVLSFLHDFFTNCIDYDNLENDEYYKKLKSGIERDEIDLIPIIEKTKLKN